MPLLDKLHLPPEQVLNPDYYVVIESHLRYLREHPATAVVTVTGQQAEKYTGDFYGLLDSLSVNKNHYLVMRVNKMHASSDYDGRTLTLHIPDTATISQFLTLFNSIES